MDSSEDNYSEQFVLPPPPEEDEMDTKNALRLSPISDLSPFETTLPPPMPPLRMFSTSAQAPVSMHQGIKTQSPHNSKSQWNASHSKLSISYKRQQSVPSTLVTSLLNKNSNANYTTVAKRVSFDSHHQKNSGSPVLRQKNSHHNALDIVSSQQMTPLKKGCLQSAISQIGNSQQNLCGQCGRLHSSQEAHVYQYREPVVADLLCQLCNQPLVEPLDTNCGHTFCKACLLVHVQTMRYCPIDNTPVREGDFHPASIIVQRLLDKLLVVCPNGSYCEQVLTRSELAAHLQQVCPGTTVSCPHMVSGCTFLGPRATLHSHLWDGECSYLQNGENENLGHSSPGESASAMSTSSPLSLSTASSMSSSAGSSTQKAQSQVHTRHGSPQKGLPSKKVCDSGISPVNQQETGQHASLRTTVLYSRMKGNNTRETSSSPQRWVTDNSKRLNNNTTSTSATGTVTTVTKTPLAHSNSHGSDGGGSGIGGGSGGVTSRQLSQPFHRHCSSSARGMRRSASQDSRHRIQPSSVFKFNIDRGVNKSDLGISIVGGRDTPLGCFVIQEIYSEGVASIDGRLTSGDQLLEVNGIDLTDATHDDGRRAFFCGGRTCEITVFRETQSLLSKNNIDDIENVISVTLQKKPGSKLGIKLVGKKNQTGLYILGLVKGGEAELDGRLQRDDRVLSINNVDVQNSNQDVAASIIATAVGSVTLVLSRFARPQTPDLIRTTEGDDDDDDDEEDSIMDQPYGSMTTSLLMEDYNEDSFLLKDGHYAKKKVLQADSGISTVSGSQCGVKTSCLGPFMACSSNSSSSTVHACEETRDKGSDGTSATPCKRQDSATSKGKRTTIPTVSSDVNDHGSWLKVSFSLKKSSRDSLGISVAGGMRSQRGDTPIYVTGLAPEGLLSKSKQLDCGDLLLSVNGANLLGLTHEAAVEQIKRVSYGAKQVHICSLRCPAWLRRTALQSGAGSLQKVSCQNGHNKSGCKTEKQPISTNPAGEIDNFLPTWIYWLTLPPSCGIPRTVMLNRTSTKVSLGFSIVGGISIQEQRKVDGKRTGVIFGMSRIHDQYQPIAVKSIVPGSIADKSGRLMCGDLLLSVNEYPLSNVSHKDAVALLKYVQGSVRLRVLSWPGTIV